MLGQTGSQIAQYGVSTGLSTVAAIPGVTAGIASAIGVATAVAVPIVGAVIAGITFAIAEFTQGCQSCIVTSNQANKIEDLMKQNLAAWQSSNKTCQEKAQCVGNFDALWGALTQFCQNPQFGGAGENCIKDRQQGACKWKDSSGQCWNWFIGYRDPIANDTCSDQLVVNNLGSNILADVQQTTGLDPTLILGGGLLLLAFMFIK